MREDLGVTRSKPVETQESRAPSFPSLEQRSITSLMIPIHHECAVICGSREAWKGMKDPDHLATSEVGFDDEAFPYFNGMLRVAETQVNHLGNETIRNLIFTWQRASLPSYWDCALSRYFFHPVTFRNLSLLDMLSQVHLVRTDSCQ